MTVQKRIKSEKKISVKGACQHNLKNVDIDIPRNTLTVISGVSGSGKSSLAFDTIYAEGQRRFVQSLSAYARQFLERMGKPVVDSISGLPPAIAIEQKAPSKNPRSTVGTSTELFDYFRLLFGRIGHTICHKCGEEVRKDTTHSIVKELRECEEGDKLYILFPLPKNTRLIRDELMKLLEKGFFRLVFRGDDELIDFEDGKYPNGHLAEDVFILVDRVKYKRDKAAESRLSESIEAAMIQGEGRMIIQNVSTEKYRFYSNKYECADCDIIYSEPEPRLFSFNNPYGACPECQGFGRTIGIDLDFVFPDKSKTLKNGVVHPFRTQGHADHNKKMLKEAEKLKIPIDEPFHKLTEEQVDFVLHGKGKYLGVYGFFASLEEKNYKIHNRVMLSRYRGYTTCKKCDGSRLRTSARQVFIGGKNLPDIIKLSLEKLLDFMKKLKLSKYDMDIAGQLLEEIKWRLQLLCDIGLEYLTLNRLTHTLSGGEAQRINLSTALGSALVGTLYVLDEPSIGMHPRDTNRLINILVKIRNLGNTVIVVEHDPDIIKYADFMIDMGPKAGEYGGEVIYSGTYKDMLTDEKSITGQYMSGKQKIQSEYERKESKDKIVIHNPRQHNLHIDKVEFPLGCMTVVTGVSGSGKSTLVHNILYAGLKKYQGTHSEVIGDFDKIEGFEDLKHIEMVDQSSIGKSKRSTPATYTKVFDHIRELFAQTQAARQLGLKPGYFSFNVPGGRCDTCDGEGYVNIDMQFLPDVQLLCENCKGSRYKRDVRNITFKDKSIIDVLDMSINEALKFFEGNRKIVDKLQILDDVGLGYLKLGQPSTMLSGGESQRIKLAGHLDSKTNGKNLFIFDEPTTGLHLDDVSKLLACFKRLIEKGHSVVIIEHNIHVIAAADWIIDLGPEAGDKGGKLVCFGTPEKVQKSKSSHTAQALREFFEENQK